MRLTESIISKLNNLTESVSWDYFDKFQDIFDKYLPSRGEGENQAQQMVTAINKLVYKWYNDGDVYDDRSGLGWANDLSSYANWLAKYIDGAAEILNMISGIEKGSESEYEDILKNLCDQLLDQNIVEGLEKQPKVGTIYDCKGNFSFSVKYDDEEEE